MGFNSAFKGLKITFPVDVRPWAVYCVIFQQDSGKREVRYLISESANILHDTSNLYKFYWQPLIE